MNTYALIRNDTSLPDRLHRVILSQESYFPTWESMPVWVKENCYMAGIYYCFNKKTGMVTLYTVNNGYELFVIHAEDTRLYELHLTDIYKIKPNWIEIWQDKILNALPHGSGIDWDWRIIYNKRTGKFTATNYYHAMNEWGGYCHVYPIKLKLYVNHLGEVKIASLNHPHEYSCCGYQLFDYIYETIDYSLSELNKEKDTI